VLARQRLVAGLEFGVLYFVFSIWFQIANMVIRQLLK
jgi:hypothetical protein